MKPPTSKETALILAKHYEENTLGTEVDSYIRDIVDKGKLRTLDYYLGAERIAITYLQFMTDRLRLPVASDVGLTWGLILAYITFRIAQLTENNSIKKK